MWRLRLEALVARLADDDLARELGGGWTAGVTLSHLAFWDTLDAGLFQRMRDGDAWPVLPYWYSEAVNAAMLPSWRLVPPQDAARLALEAASAVDATVASLEDSLVQVFLARDEAWMLRRYLHRREHIAQIEGALGLEK